MKILKYKWNSTPQIGLGFSTQNHIILGLPFDIKIWIPFLKVSNSWIKAYYRRFSK